MVQTVMGKTFGCNKNSEGTIWKSRGNERHAVFEVIDGNRLTSYFQPIVFSGDGEIYGYEALARIRGESVFGGIHGLFKTAIQTGTISSLDVKCRENAMSLASGFGLGQSTKHLFINVCPETLMDTAHRPGITDELAEKWQIPKEKIVLEITEESAIHNYDLFMQSITYYRSKGYTIAIDDFGAGFGGLKMLSIIEPDFVKIDRHFISFIDRMSVKKNLVDSIVYACRRMGIGVIAEGIEREEESRELKDLGVELFQGYYISKPQPALDCRKTMFNEVFSQHLYEGGA